MKTKLFSARLIVLASFCSRTLADVAPEALAKVWKQRSVSALFVVGQDAPLPQVSGGVRADLLAKAGLFFLGLVSIPAFASFPQATASGNYVQAEVRLGVSGQSPGQMQQIGGPAVSAGQVFSGGEGQRICARREGNPGHANSGMTYWSCADSYNGIQVGQPSTTSF